MSTPRSAAPSQVPLEPSVHTHNVTCAPAADHLASVAPAPNSMSSAWAPIARTRVGTGRSTAGVIEERVIEPRGSLGSGISEEFELGQIGRDVDVECQLGIAHDANGE